YRQQTGCAESLEGRGVGRVLAWQLDLAAEHGQTVAEAAIDRGFGGPQCGQRLPARVAIVELGAHQRREDAATPGRGQDGDDVHRRGWYAPAGHCPYDRIDARTPNDRVAVPRRVHAIGRQVLRERVELLWPGLDAAEVVPHHTERGPDLVVRIARPDRPGH